MRKRNLSKYTFERRPEDRTKSPCSSEASISRSARSSGMARSIGSRWACESRGSSRGPSWYRSVARPLLFSLPPEAAHRLAQPLLGLPLPWERLGGADRDPALRRHARRDPAREPRRPGRRLRQDRATRRRARTARVRVRGRAGRSRAGPARGNAKPRIVRYPERGSMVNAMGLPNPGAEAAARALGRTTPRRPPVREHRRRGPARRARDPRAPGAARRRGRAERELPERRVGSRPRQRDPPREPGARARRPPDASVVRQAPAVPHRRGARGGARARRDRAGRRAPTR